VAIYASTTVVIAVAVKHGEGQQHKKNYIPVPTKTASDIYTKEESIFTIKESNPAKV
jgi:hypothetical protein